MNAFARTGLAFGIASLFAIQAAADDRRHVGDIVFGVEHPRERHVPAPVPRQQGSTITIACTAANTNVKIVDDMKSNTLQMDVNDVAYRFESRAVTGFDITLCGRSNSVDYQVGTTPVMNLPRRFDITGGAGFDYVSLDFQANVRGETVRYGLAPSIHLDLGALSDQVEVRLQDFGKGLFVLDAELGDGHDGLTLLEYGGEMRGSASVMIDGGQGNDGLYVDLSNRTPTDIPTGASMSIWVWGDEAGPLDPRDNVADHGNDFIVVEMHGRVDGSLASNVYGDDQNLRLRDIFCGGCAFSSRRDGLEQALREQRGYADDVVQTRYAVDPDSRGTTRVFTTGGLADDSAVLVVEGDVSDLEGFDATLDGGQFHRGQTDTCWTDSDRVNVRNCPVMSPEISVF